MKDADHVVCGGEVLTTSHHLTLHRRWWCVGLAETARVRCPERHHQMLSNTTIGGVWRCVVVWWWCVAVFTLVARAFEGRARQTDTYTHTDTHTYKHTLSYHAPRQCLGSCVLSRSLFPHSGSLCLLLFGQCFEGCDWSFEFVGGR